MRSMVAMSAGTMAAMRTGSMTTVSRRMASVCRYMTLMAVMVIMTVAM